MANPFSKGWKYLSASLDQKIEENADPLVQIKQATDAAKKQYQQISQHAASVIGNQKQLQMSLYRLLEEQKKLTEQARQAIQLADKAQASGDVENARKYSDVAEVYATQLVAVEQRIEETTVLHEQAKKASEEAKKQVSQAELRLKDQMAQIDQLTQQVNQTKMQEASVEAMDQMAAINPDRDVPTLDSVREKIEQRYANALGAQELAGSDTSAIMAEVEAAQTDVRAANKLAEIRAQLSADSSTENSQLTTGEDKK